MKNIASESPGRHRRHLRWLSIAAAAGSVGALSLTLAPGAAANFIPLTVTAPSTTTVAGSSTTALAGMSVTGDANDTLQVIASTDFGTLALPEHAGLNLSYNNTWSAATSIAFTGSQADIDTALASATLTNTSSTAASANISITALVMPQTGSYYYLPATGHFYEYVSSPSITWNAADAAAQGLSFHDQPGYLATIQSATVNNFISGNIQGATNVWFGARAYESSANDGTATEGGTTYARVWRWTEGANESPIAGGIVSECTNLLSVCSFTNAANFYSSWASGEPNDAGGSSVTPYQGEWAPVTNWNGTSGKWNDLTGSGAASTSGYVVEFGGKTNQNDASTNFSAVYTATSTLAVTAPVTSPATVPVTAPGTPKVLTTKTGDRTLTVTFTPPASDGGSPITGYQISLDGGRTWKTVKTTGTTKLTATVTGVLNGHKYTVQVRALNGAGASGRTTVKATTPHYWFADTVSKKARAAEIAKPKNLSTYAGPLAHTKATLRSATGVLAMPVSAIHGRQLQPGQAASLGVDGLFAFNSAVITPSGHKAIKELVASLRYDKAVVCEGFTDYGGSSANEAALSSARAKAVCAALKAAGAKVSTSEKSYGAAIPVVVGGTRGQRSENRRVVIVVTR